MGISKSIVYFGYLGDEGTDGGVVRQRLSFMDRQLRWLSDLMEASGERIEVLVPYVAPRAWDAEVHGVITRYGFRIDPASVRAERRNTFEYPGFRALKALAEQSDPDDLIYYCHSKGIVLLDESKMGLFRIHTEVGITADLDMLTASSALTRASIFPYKFGWCWYNFFWIKAGYMAGLSVEESADRYHFEALIGDRSDKEGYRGVLPLIDRLPFEDTGIAAKPWYRAEETSSPALFATYDRYAGMQSPADSANARKALADRRARAGSKPRSPLSLAYWTRLFGGKARVGKLKV
ncbi:hypothetical protein [Sphingomonas sp. PR090111-T3T-6A]|uniref:hypothetical protein n=1 Tax=Sphingomonas sp. PR090111-T3T-6A TaxID=685778 RepID=UPI00037AB55C|nr:hypothetical protein [Sphingomonas sp. PR090111-T3T-6A]